MGTPNDAPLTGPLPGGRRRYQRGQAIVLIAIMLAVVVGMAALAIDGSRAYALRRDLQAAVDAAALAAGDNLQQAHSYTPAGYASAEQAATTSFGTNMRLYIAPSCFPSYGAPPLTVTCTYSDGTVLMQVISALGPAGTDFVISGSRLLVLEFARILTNGTTPRLSAVATGGVNNLLYTPTIAALSGAGCGGSSGTAISTVPGGTLNVVGDVVSSGAISIQGSAQVAGDVYARCQSSVPNLTNTCYPSGSFTPCTSPDVAGTTKAGYNFIDPNYPQPAVTGPSWGQPGSNVVLSPGTYPADPMFISGRCYFLAGGVYMWQGGYTNSGSFVSNELRPPDEPLYSNNMMLDGHQFWNTDSVRCAGSTQLTVVTGPRGIAPGQWAFVVTSTRTATYNGQSYVRESPPSVCYTGQINGSGENFHVTVSNVPGATAYNIYAAPGGSCSGPFGLAKTLPVTATELNNGTAGCPAFSGSGCSLGYESIDLDSSDLGSLGANQPDGETAPLRFNLPNENASRAAPPHGDRANENQCDTVGGALTTCPGPITPGAAAFVIPAGGCLNATSNGDNQLFSGYQYNWMAVYEPPANNCGNSLGAASDSAFVGMIYTPGATITINKAATFRTDEGGGVIANTLIFTGQLPTIIGDPDDYGPVPPAAKLTG